MNHSKKMEENISWSDKCNIFLNFDIFFLLHSFQFPRFFSRNSIAENAKKNIFAKNRGTDSVPLTDSSAYRTYNLSTSVASLTHSPLLSARAFSIGAARLIAVSFP